MTASDWRPLGFEGDEGIAQYDALHDGIPSWMEAPYWAWVREQISIVGHYDDGSGRFPLLDIDFAEAMCQRLRLSLPTLSRLRGPATGNENLSYAINVLKKFEPQLGVADYLLAHHKKPSSGELESLLARCKSVYTVGERAGHPGLVRRVPIGVQVASDSVMARSGNAGMRLARAWEALYGIEARPSEAYRLAIQAVEDAAIPVVSPGNDKATLGTVLAQVEQQADWALPMAREHERSPTRDVLINMARALWHGQHDRHGGKPSSPGDVSEAEARVAVSLAVALVSLFSDGLVQRASAADL